MKICWLLLLSLAAMTSAQLKGDESNGSLAAKVDHLPDWIKSTSEWEVPEGLKEDLPSYLSGYSYDGRPVYVLEFGKWDTVKYVDSTEDNRRIYYKRIDNLLSALVTETSPIEDAESGSVVIFDLDGLLLRQLISPKAVQAHLEFMRRVESVEELIAEFFFVNTIFVAQNWLNLVRPVAGRLMGRATLVGTGKEKIAAVFAKLLPSSRYAAKYGGKSEFVPLKRF